MTASQAFAFALALRLHHAPLPAPQAVQVSGATMSCVFLTARDLRGAFRGKHSADCVAANGEIVGAILTPAGRVYCTVGGYVESTGCLLLNVCGRYVEQC